jgi:hypothetical protein
MINNAKSKMLSKARNKMLNPTKIKNKIVEPVKGISTVKVEDTGAFMSTRKKSLAKPANVPVQDKGKK